MTTDLATALATALAAAVDAKFGTKSFGRRADEHGPAFAASANAASASITVGDLATGPITSYFADPAERRKIAVVMLHDLPTPTVQVQVLGNDTGVYLDGRLCGVLGYQEPDTESAIKPGWFCGAAHKGERPSAVIEGLADRDSALVALGLALAVSS